MKLYIFISVLLCLFYSGLSLYLQKPQSGQSQASPYDILITEILPDPIPSVGLPEAEFIELYNNSNKFFDLTGYELSIGSRAMQFPEFTIEPGSYYIICRSDFIAQYYPWGNTIPLDNFPVVPNSGSTILLKNTVGITIHGVDYNQNWHRNSETKYGGWSLELINLENGCYQGVNWASSLNLAGGTPGKENSWANSATPSDSFRLITAIPDPPTRLRIIFNRNLLHINDPVVSLLTFDPNPPQPARIYFGNVLKSNLIVEMNQAFSPGIQYTLECRSLRDCGEQNPIIQNIDFKLHENPAPGDILINEILFNPPPGGRDFVELINVSHKYILLSDLWLANTCSGYDISKLTYDYLVKPNDLIVISDDVRSIQEQYSVEYRYLLLENTIPSFDNLAGCVVVYTLVGNKRIIIDSFYYDNALHSPFIRDREGVSLERVSIRHPTNEKGNWQSAAHTAGYGTPAKTNSQTRIIPFSSDVFKINPITFSPNGDGVDDFIQIHYALDNPGFGLLVKIFDIKGRLVRFLANGYRVSVSGAIVWDGATEEGILAPAGVYTIWIKAYNEAGQIKETIKNCILAHNF